MDSLSPAFFLGSANKIHRYSCSATKQTVAHVRREIRRPTGLSDTVFSSGVWNQTEQRPTSTDLGDGGVYLAKWLRVPRHNRLLTADAALTTVKVPGVGEREGTSARRGVRRFLNSYWTHQRTWQNGAFEARSSDSSTTVSQFIILCNRADLNCSILT